MRENAGRDNARRENVGVARYISDDPFTMLRMQGYGTSFNLDGIWGGNMYAGGAGAIHHRRDGDARKRIGAPREGV